MTNLERLLRHKAWPDCAPWFGVIFDLGNGHRLKLVAQNDLHVPYFVRMRGKRQMKTQVCCVAAESRLRKLQKKDARLKAARILWERHDSQERWIARFRRSGKVSARKRAELRARRLRKAAIRLMMLSGKDGG